MNNTAFLLKAKPIAFAVPVEVFDAHSNHSADACEAVNHDGDQCAIAQADQRSGVDAVEKATRILW